MSNIISYVRATGEIQIDDKQKLLYEFVIRPNRPLPLNKLHELHVDVEDFERYLTEKYSTGIKYEKSDSFSVWKKLKQSIKKIF